MYGAPKQRNGILGALIDGAGNFDSKNTQNKTEKLNERLLEIKKIHANIVAAYKLAKKGLILNSSRKRVDTLSEAFNLVANSKLHGAGKYTKKSLTELKCLVELSEAKKLVNDKPSQTKNLIRFLQKEYATTKARLADLEAGKIYDGVSDESKKLLKSNDKLSKSLTIGKRGYTITKAPIIPIVDKAWLDTSRVSGLKIKNLTGYSLIEDQLVIGISNKEIAKRGKAIDAANDILDTINTVTNKKLNIVSKKPNRHNGNLWFWVASEKVLNQLYRAYYNNLNIRDWGFGFSSE